MGMQEESGRAGSTYKFRSQGSDVGEDERGTIERSEEAHEQKRGLGLFYTK